jgi:flagellar biosynthesis/type III secretory pathway M-ring protein FliF/YscJ
VILGVVAGGTNDPATYNVGSVHVSTSVFGVYILGVATLLVLVLGLLLVRAGAARARRRREDSRKLQRLSERVREQEAEKQRREGETTEPAIDPATGQTTAPATGETTVYDSSVHSTATQQDQRAPGS